MMKNKTREVTRYKLESMRLVQPSLIKYTLIHNQIINGLNAIQMLVCPKMLAHVILFNKRYMKWFLSLNILYS